MSELVLPALLLVLLLVLVGQAVHLVFFLAHPAWRRAGQLTIYERASRPAEESRAAADESSADDSSAEAPETALRHHHRPGPKDADGIRHCRCGDRYLDGVRG